MLTLLVLLAVVAVCLLVEGFYSGSETAIISADRVQLWAEARRGDPRAALAHRLLERTEVVLSTTLVGTNLAVVTGTSVATLLMSHYVPPDWQSFVTTLVMSPLILVVGEIVPKSIGRAGSHAITLRVAGVLRASQRVMSPIISSVSWVADRLLSLAGIRPVESSPYVTREELVAMAEIGEKHGVLVSEERRMIESVLELRDRPVSSVMVPLVNIASVPLGATVADLEREAARRPFSRFPVHEGRVDNIVGIVSTVDVLRAEALGDPAATPIEPFVQREVAYVPETKPVGELLRELRYSSAPMAFVVEEHGGVVGLATVTDLVEEVVGRIRDARLEGPADLIARGSRVFECDGDMDVTELAELTGLAIRKEGFETVGGLVMKLTGHIPQAGDSVDFGPFRVEVLEASSRRVQRLRFTRVRGGGRPARRA